MGLFEVLLANMMLICGANNIKITGYCRASSNMLTGGAITPAVEQIAPPVTKICPPPVKV